VSRRETGADNGAVPLCLRTERIPELDIKNISQAVIGRLPRYYRYLGELKDEGVERISSQELSKEMHVTASQIRQDFNHFGGFGQQGYGYNTEYLYNEIGKILGLDQKHNMILVGAGNLGSALVRYMNFRNRGFFFKAAFDINEALYGKQIAGITVYPLDSIADYIRENEIDIAVLTIPKAGAVKVAEVLSTCPIKAIWNFAHTDLELPERIQVENVHLSDSLMRLSYEIRRYEEESSVKTPKKSTHRK
jgi:redox-sensing transcriptional repressor